MGYSPARFMLKILHVINGSLIGGAERLLLSLLAKHDRSVVDLSVCNTFFEEGPFVDKVREAGCRIVPLPAASMRAVPRMTMRLARHIRNERYDVINTHLLHSSIVGQAAARIARTGVRMVTRHYTEEGYTNRGRMIRKADAWAARKAHHVVAVSESVREHLVANGVQRDRITIIHNGIDLDEIDRGASGAPPGGGNIHLGAVGSLTARKGHAILLRAFSKLPPGLGARLTIVGEGPEREVLQSLIADLGIGERARLAGYRSDIWSFLREVDVYVQPSLQESFGIAVLEALAARKPVIAARTGGIPEIINDDQSGLLVPPGDADALAAALVRVIEQPELRARLAAGGRRRVETAFSIEGTARQYEQLYAALAGRG